MCNTEVKLIYTEENLDKKQNTVQINILRLKMDVEFKESSQCKITVTNVLISN